MKRTGIVAILALTLVFACQKPPEPEPAATVAQETRTMWVSTVIGLNLRSRPGPESGVIAILPYNTQVQVLKEPGAGQAPGDAGDQWVRIRSGEDEGYVFAAYLSETRNPEPGPAVTGKPAALPTDAQFLSQRKFEGELAEVASALRKIERDRPDVRKAPYETPGEFETRRRNLLSAFETERRQRLDDLFGKTGRWLAVSIPVYDAEYTIWNSGEDTTKAELHSPENPDTWVRIPPEINLYGAPILGYQEPGRDRFTNNGGSDYNILDYNLTRDVARKYDINSNHGEFRITFHLKLEGGSPVLLLRRVHWDVDGDTIWRWSGQGQRSAP